MSLTYRSTTGRRLTVAEGDRNIYELSRISTFTVDIRRFMTSAQQADALLATPTLDHSDALSAAVTYIMGTQGSVSTRGGAIYIPGGYRLRLDTPPWYVLPNDGESLPTQVPLRIYGDGFDTHTTGTISSKGASVIDFRYTTSTAKIDTRGRGVLEIDHLVLADESGNSDPFILTTNTCINIHDNMFLGSKTSAWDQDCIYLGGTSTSINGTSSAPFQGYGSQIHNNHFHRIRRVAYARTFANSIPIHHNTIWADCGFTSGAAIEYDGEVGLSSQSITGTPNNYNLIEMVNYQYGIKARMVASSAIGPNDFYDPGSAVTSYYFMDYGSEYNTVIAGYHNDNDTFVSEFSTVANKNSWISGHQSQDTVFSQAVIFKDSSNTSPAVSSSGSQVFFSHGRTSSTAIRQYYNAATSTYVVGHLPGGSEQQLLNIKDFGSGIVIITLQGTDTRIQSAAGLIQLAGASQINGSLALQGGATVSSGGLKTAAASLDFGSTDATSSSVLTISLSNAQVGDAVMLGIPHSAVSSLVGAYSFHGWVSTAGVVAVQFSNMSAGALDPATGTFRAWVIQSA